MKQVIVSGCLTQRIVFMKGAAYEMGTTMA